VDIKLFLSPKEEQKKKIITLHYSKVFKLTKLTSAESLKSSPSSSPGGLFFITA